MELAVDWVDDNHVAGHSLFIFPSMSGISPDATGVTGAELVE